MVQLDFIGKNLKAKQRTITDLGLTGLSAETGRQKAGTRYSVRKPDSLDQ
jgi:hypothetical protein